MKVQLDPKAKEFMSKKGKNDLMVYVKGCSS